MSAKPNLPGKPYYITTAIAYPNGAPHIGHAYEAIATDAIARFATARRPRRILPHRHRRTRHQDAADGGQGKPDAAATGRTQCAALPSHGEKIRMLERRFHPHHRSASPRLLGRDLAAHGSERRHLSRQIFRLVFGARRGLLRRERNAPRRKGPARRPARHAGRMGRGGKLLFQAVQIRRAAAQALPRSSGFRAAERAHERGRKLRPRRPAGSVAVAHHLRLGHQGAGQRQAHHVCVGRRADQLHHGGGLSQTPTARNSRNSGRPICMSSARTSCAFMPCIGRPF